MPVSDVLVKFIYLHGVVEHTPFEEFSLMVISFVALPFSCQKITTAQKFFVATVRTIPECLAAYSLPKRQPTFGI